MFTPFIDHMSSSIPEEDDRTVIRPPTAKDIAGREAPATAPEVAAAPTLSVAPRSTPPPAAASSAGDSGNALPVGTYLAEFEITSVLGEGGFGIVYLARDHSLQRLVALKEYMPAAMAARTGQTQVHVKSERHRDTFDAGLKSFVNEARLLAQFDHPSLVKVYRFWEANGTAYMVMPFYEGVTLKDRLRALGAPPDEAWLTALLAPLTEALAVIHAESCFHRDIAPDNVILLGPTERPLLLDFGAARRVIGDMTQALTVILKPGYAPIEQYAESPDMKQGSWTDVYALAATMHFAIMGKTPPASVSRLMNDNYMPLEQAAAGRYSAGFLQALDKALRVRPQERTTSVEAMRADLGLVGDGSPSQTLFLNSQQTATRAPSQQLDKAAPRIDPSRAAAVTPARSRLPLWLGLGATAGAAALGAFFMLQPDAAAPPAPTAAEAPAAPVASSAVPPTIPQARFDVNEQFSKVLSMQSAGFTVDAVPAKRQLQIGRDRLAFSVTSSRDGYVQVIVMGPDGSLVLLWPNTQSATNQIKAGQTLTLPQSSWALETTEPAGLEQFLIVVSEHPRDYSVLSKEREFYFLKLPTGERADALVGAWDRVTPLLLGAAAGTCTGSTCDVYGAARFTVDVVK